MFFDEIYKKHFNELKRFGRQLNIPAEKCEDLTQETFLKFYLELKKEIVFDNPRAWLYKVYLNLFRTNQQNKRDFFVNQESRIAEPSTDPDEELIHTEKQEIVFGMLKKMNEKDREILLLYNKGFSYSEIAEVLEINPASVGKTLVRAIEKFKEMLKTHCHELFEQN